MDGEPEVANVVRWRYTMEGECPLAMAPKLEAYVRASVSWSDTMFPFLHPPAKIEVSQASDLTIPNAPRIVRP